MEDFRTIFYVILAIIFIVSRVMKSNKSKKQAPPARRRPNPNQGGNAPQGKRQAPTSFEDLLKEFAEEANEQERGSQQVSQREQRSTLSSREERPAARPQPKERQFEEGRTRRFSDEESRKIYEESVKRAEGFDIDFKADEKFKSRRTKFGEGAVESSHHKSNPIIASIKKDLKDPQSIKKAFILGEVLNKKY